MAFGANASQASMRNRMLLGLAAALIALVALSSALSPRASKHSAASGNAEQIPASADPLAPEFTLTDLTGRQLQLSELRGQVVVLDFWATWCGPCRLETPHLVELRNRFQKQGVEVIGISLDEGDIQSVRDFAGEFKISYPIAMGTQRVEQQYGPITAIPTLFVIDRAGRIRLHHEGLLPYEDLSNAIEKLL